MKKTLLLVSRYFSRFLTVIFIFSLLLIYIMFKVPVILWVGSLYGTNFNDNFGGILVKFMENNYISFFLFPFFPILVGFFVLSVFIWVYYRHDKETGRFGFINSILAVLTAFTLIFLPIKSAQLGYKIQEQREKELSAMRADDPVEVNKRLDREILKVYQSLYKEGILKWRGDPVAVVNYELKEGDLKYLSRGQDKLTLQSVESDQSSNFSHAIVMLENDRFKAEIRLTSYWDTEDRVWTVKNYKEIK